MKGVLQRLGCVTGGLVRLILAGLAGRLLALVDLLDDLPAAPSNVACVEPPLDLLVAGELEAQAEDGVRGLAHRARPENDPLLRPLVNAEFEVRVVRLDGLLGHAYVFRQDAAVGDPQVRQ